MVMWQVWLCYECKVNMYGSCSVLEVKDAILQVSTHSLQLSWQGQVSFARTGGSDVVRSKSLHAQWEGGGIGESQ